MHRRGSFCCLICSRGLSGIIIIITINIMQHQSVQCYLWGDRHLFVSLQATMAMQ